MLLTNRIGLLHAKRAGLPARRMVICLEKMLGFRVRFLCIRVSIQYI